MMSLEVAKQFGADLIKTLDLDPLYVGLTGANLKQQQLARWLLAYLCFYHVGVASAMSDLQGQDYWELMYIAAKNQESPAKFDYPGERWPRAAERRHFRGVKCVNAIEILSQRQPESYIEELLLCCSDQEIMNCVQSWPMFGKWVSFKALDLLERCAGGKVQVSADVVLLYDQPRNSLQQIAEGSGLASQDCYEQLLDYFAQYRAPPDQRRKCGPAEVETIACKTGSLHTGHYWLGKDIHEQRRALYDWGVTAKRILVAYPVEVNNAALH